LNKNSFEKLFLFCIDKRKSNAYNENTEGGLNESIFK